MRITKFVHSCLLVESESRTVLFDPGAYSQEAFDIARVSKLDNIFISHIHPDHAHVPFIKLLVEKFPNVKIVSTNEVVTMLSSEGIKAQSNEIEGIAFFNSPHENVAPLFDAQPEETGFHYLNKLTDPGDSHSFNETKDILALPITAPWGSAVSALNLVIKLKPKFVIPIHDWHWTKQARQQMYDKFEEILSEKGINFFKIVSGQPIEIPD